MEQKHSGLGIASFVTSIAAGILLIASSVVAFSMEYAASDADGIFFLFVFTVFIADLVALGLGIGGLCQKDQKKIFAILGTVISALVGMVMIFVAIG